MVRLAGEFPFASPVLMNVYRFKRAVDLKNVEALTGGKSDPYVRVLVNGVVVGRTEVVNNKCVHLSLVRTVISLDASLNPDWDEILYITVHR